MLSKEFFLLTQSILRKWRMRVKEEQEIKISPEVSGYCAMCTLLPKNLELDDKAVYKLV